MKIERTLQIRNILKTRIADIYASACLTGEPSATIQQWIAKAKADCPKGTPQWVYSYIDGFIAAKQDELYRDWLIFGGYIDGVFYSTNRKRDDHYENCGIDPAAYADNGFVQLRGHYWSDRVQYHGGIYSRDSVKPYFIG